MKFKRRVRPTSRTDTTRSKRGVLRQQKAIEVFEGDDHGTWTLRAECESLNEAATIVGASNGGTISRMVDTDKVYKGKYRFITRRRGSDIDNARHAKTYDDELEQDVPF